MKLKSVFHLLGLKPRAREYGYEVRKFDLPRAGCVDYAQWLHPKDTPKEISQSEVDFLRRFLSEGDVAIDIGAHTGDSTLPIALAVGPRGHVLALEPNRYVFKVLVKNAELNPDKTSIEPLMYAATVDDGPIEFEYSDPGFCNGGRHEGISRWVHGHAFTLTVQGCNLERYLRSERRDLIDRLRYIKVDAEGYDGRVIKSMLGLIAQTRPFIKAEMYKHANRERRIELYQPLRKLGYQLHRLVDHGSAVGEVINADNLSAWQHYDVLCSPHESPLAWRNAA